MTIGDCSIASRCWSWLGWKSFWLAQKRKSETLRQRRSSALMGRHGWSRRYIPSRRVEARMGSLCLVVAKEGIGACEIEFRGL
jgi:hypothetical protein